jgi:cytoskeletal protein RodZ
MKLRLLAAWSVATFIAIVLAYQAVGLVQSQVTERPPAFHQVVDTAAPETIDTIEDPGPTVTVPTEATDRVDASPATTVTTTTDTTTSSEVPASTTSTSSTTSSTSTSSTSTTSTSTPDVPTVKLISSIGGWVRVSCTADDEAAIDSLTPASGFEFEIDEDGPHRVRVEFKSDDHESKIQATCDDGEVVYNVAEKDDD